MTRSLGGVLLLLGHGCGLVLDLELEPPADGAQLDAAKDGGRFDAGAADASAADAATGEGGADAAMTFDPCDTTWAADGLIAVYGFEYNLSESVGEGAPDASFVPEPEAMPWWPGPCGPALAFDGMSWAVIPHWDRWREVKSIDFWLFAPRATEMERPRGVLSRDADTQGEGGHITISRTGSDRITVRLQDDAASGDQDNRCSPPIDLSDWIHVGVNVDPSLELWVNGEPVDETGVDEVAENLRTFGCSDDVRGADPTATPDLCCTTAPWLLGAANHRSTEGTVDQIENPLLDGAMDRLRFSTVRRDFSLVAR